MIARKGVEHAIELAGRLKGRKAKLLIGATRGLTESCRRRYSLWDCYHNADFVIYPSTCEGFGQV